MRTWNPGGSDGYLVNGIPFFSLFSFHCRSLRLSWRRKENFLTEVPETPSSVASTLKKEKKSEIAAMTDDGSSKKVKEKIAAFLSLLLWESE